MGSNKIFKQLNQLITASIKGDMFDAKEFTISYLKAEGNSEVHFIPVDAQFAEFIKAIHLTFNAKGEVMQVKMVEASEDYTMIVFSNRKTNQTLSDGVFAQWGKILGQDSKKWSNVGVLGWSLKNKINLNTP